MKKILLVLIAIVLVVPSFSQNSTTTASAPEKNVLKINTISLVTGTGSIFFEHRISNSTSGQLGFAYMMYKASDVKFSGAIITPEFRFYVKKNAIDGMYVAPYLRYFNLSASEANEKVSFSVTGGGLLLGRQWIKKSGFTMDLFFGAHYGSAKFKASDGNTDWVDVKLFSGLKPRVGFALGFAF